MNGHNYLKQQFDIQGISYKMQDNSSTHVSSIDVLESLVKEFQSSIALNRINTSLSASCKKACKASCDNPAKIEQVYLQINDAVKIILSELKMVA